ncbi:TetR/AcrR family transcriptional regulator [Humibacter albus]|uniref:TetR/AcrR family transcriptional regulator n=1 Tax=Humibacter albus TaxID=427754 RepID=UPI0003B4FBA7|nr:TetR/AcrR family transcriptional regulator [Humibacter albus]
MIEEILVGTKDAANAASLRVEPAQDRSLARIDALLDAAAAVVDEVGFDRLSTAQVAETSGASIGTVYRYFPDRIALLTALRDRAILRYRLTASDELERRSPETWQEAFVCLADVYEQMFRVEPGFRILRFEEVHGAGEADDTPDHLHEFAERVAQVLATRYAFDWDDELVFRLEVATQLASSLIERAHVYGPAWRSRLLAEAPGVAVAYLEKFYD